MREPTKATCVCGSAILCDTIYRYDPSTGPPICGPGSKAQFKEFTTYLCGACGLLYDGQVMRERLKDA